MIFQCMFAVITPALIVGAFAERKRFKAFVVFSLAWATFVYALVAHWVWGVGGWLRDYGALDFAGGTVVHITSGVSALVAAMMLGKRVGFGKEPMDPHNLTLTVLGAGLLWFGWFGFNAGSALWRMVSRQTPLSPPMWRRRWALTWMTVSWIRHGHPSVLGAAAGAVAGLVGITPAAGFVSPSSAILIGLGAGAFCRSLHDLLKSTLQVDDALDVFAVHGVGGIWGALATGIFAPTFPSTNTAPTVFYGNPGQLVKQAVAVAVVVAFSAVATFAILKLVDLAIGLRVPEQRRSARLDSTQHGELAYQL